jgi:hypothetical protein
MNISFVPTHRAIPLIPAVIALLVLSNATNATEGGGSNYLPGFYGDFAMAVFPDPGTYFNNFFAAYQDTSTETGTLLEMPGIIHVTDQKILGGQFIFGVYPGVLASKDHSGSNNHNRVGLGDFYFVPGGLNWKWQNITAFLFEGIVAPTGRFETGDFNTGRNYWTFDHNLQLTLNLPADNEISMDIGYMNNLTNPATDYKSGDEFHFDYTVGHYFTGTMGGGVTGSYYQQVTQDISYQGLNVTQAVQATSLGPVIMYTPRINEQDVSMSLKWLSEFDVIGRAPQEYLIFRIFTPF